MMICYQQRHTGTCRSYKMKGHYVCILYWIIQISIVVAILNNNNKKPKLPKNYNSLSAYEKQQTIWNIIQSKNGTQSSYPSSMEQLLFLLKNNNPSFYHNSDIVPYNHKKFIHTIGAVTLTRFKITNKQTNPFTGIFQTGSLYGITRFSLSSQSSKSESSNNRLFSPGIAIKFFRSNNNNTNTSLGSANMFARIGFAENQIGGNFFQNELMNVRPQPTSSTKVTTKLTTLNFRRSTKFPYNIGVSNIAKYYENGTSVITTDNTKDFNFPYQIILVPNPNLTTAFTNITTEQQLKTAFITKIESKTILYTIYGIQSPINLTRILIGTLITTSQPIYSMYGDEVLFFQHQRMEDDIKIRPEWKQHIKRKQNLNHQKQHILLPYHHQQQQQQQQHVRKSSRRLRKELLQVQEESHLSLRMHSNMTTITANSFTSSFGCAFAHLV